MCCYKILLILYCSYNVIINRVNLNTNIFWISYKYVLLIDLTRMSKIRAIWTAMTLLHVKNVICRLKSDGEWCLLTGHKLETAIYLHETQIKKKIEPSTVTSKNR